MAGPDLDGKIKVRTTGAMGDEPPRAPGRNDQGMNERLDVPGHDEAEALAPSLMDRLGAGLQALAGIIVAAVFVRSRPTSGQALGRPN